MPKSNPSKGPGRPAADQSPGVERALLNATRELCLELGLDAATTKLIASRAGVNPAMINYYFKSKAGLCQAMMLDAMAPLLAQLDGLARMEGLALPLKEFVRRYMRTLSNNPWLPQLVVREVLPANGRYRELFLTQIASRAAKLLPRMIESERARGGIDLALDPKLMMISLASLAVFPFLAAPVLESVLGVDVCDEDFVERLATHSVALLTKAVSPEGES
jgi:TetR/AcrR family transcriptional regulator